MKVYTHWETHPGTGGFLIGKKFFGRKSAQQAAAKAAEAKGLQVIAEHEWTVEPTAESVAEFCQVQIDIRDASPEAADMERQDALEARKLELLS